MRPFHSLSKLNSTARPNRSIYFDSESWIEETKNDKGEDVELHHPYLICATYSYTIKKESKNFKKGDQRTKELVFTGNEFSICSEFWKSAADFTRLKHPVNIYAHNAGYDVLATRGVIELPLLGFRAKSLFDKGTTYIVKFIHDDGRVINIISSMNYFSASLAYLGKIFNLPKLDYKHFVNIAPNKEELKIATVYCKRDVEICQLAVESFISFVRDEQLGSVGMTVASQAFIAFRYRFMTHMIFIHDKVPVIEMERNSYAGGRVECWRRGVMNKNKTYYKLDINSMYPHVMKNNLPTHLISYQRFRNTIDDLKKWIDDGFLLVANVRIKTETNCIPQKEENGLFFPIGEFNTSLCTPELQIAIDKNLIMEVYEVSLYKNAPIFKSYVDYFYPKRLLIKARKENPHANDSIMDTFYKLFLNSLYGKTGQKKEIFTLFDENADPYELSYKSFMEDSADGAEVKHGFYKTFGGTSFKHYTGDEEEAFHSFPAIASHVTSYARAHLWQLIEKAGVKNVFYMDTDSLFVNEAGYENLKDEISETILGKLKLEETSTIFSITAPKHYTFGEKSKLKGIGKNDKLVEENIYETTHWGKLASYLRDGKLINYYTQKRLKHISGDYKKGVTHSDGTVTPHIKNEKRR